ncbi:hypothetical protein EVAR_72051_1 [Eumeta japonica]|uniref:Uncharacterized protein n=1 Tax=Eumeta variegata TaxID=151549 RepID=A0A4C1T2A5_EUMVA|nr:hypothetical protein EVAR_72051_1 [Eumeta japonica]
MGGIKTAAVQLCIKLGSPSNILPKSRRGHKRLEIRHVGSSDHLCCARSRKEKPNTPAACGKRVVPFLASSSAVLLPWSNPYPRIHLRGSHPSPPCSAVRMTPWSWVHMLVALFNAVLVQLPRRKVYG